MLRSSTCCNLYWVLNLLKNYPFISVSYFMREAESLQDKRCCENQVVGPVSSHHPTQFQWVKLYPPALFFGASKPCISQTTEWTQKKKKHTKKLLPSCLGQYTVLRGRPWISHETTHEKKNVCCWSVFTVPERKEIFYSSITVPVIYVERGMLVTEMLLNHAAIHG